MARTRHLYGFGFRENSQEPGYGQAGYHFAARAAQNENGQREAPRLLQRYAGERLLERVDTRSPPGNTRHGKPEDQGVARETQPSSAGLGQIVADPCHLGVTFQVVQRTFGQEPVDGCADGWELT